MDFCKWRKLIKDITYSQKNREFVGECCYWCHLTMVVMEKGCSMFVAGSGDEPFIHQYIDYMTTSNNLSVQLKFFVGVI